jgi:hypothetical protein
MDASEILLKALGLQGVNIESIKLSDDFRSAHITIRQRRDCAQCSRCRAPLYGVKQWRRRRFRGPPLGAIGKVEIIFYQLQGGCGECVKDRLGWAPFIHPRFKQISTAFAETAGRLMEEITCEAVGRLLMYDSKSLWGLDQWRMRRMKQDLKFPEKLSFKLMSADEVHLRTVKPKKEKWNKEAWDRRFVTNLVLYNHAKVIANAAGRDARSLKNCLLQLTEAQRLSVEYLAVDMHDPFLKAARKLCPNAEIAVDRFHLAEALNRRFDEIRKEEFQKAQEQADLFQQKMLSGSRRFILVERDKDLSSQDLQSLKRLREMNQNIHTAMLLVEYFHAVLDKKEVRSFRKGLELWYGLVKESKLKPLQAFARLVRKYRLEIETYIKSHLTTAVSEGLNTKIKTLKRMGYGYSNEESFMHKILQRCGFLNSRWIKTDAWFFEVPVGT